MTNFIVCDLDDCLLKTDLLYEQWLLLVKSKPLLSLQSPFRILQGKAKFKSWLAKSVPIDASSLPYRSSVVEVLKSHRMSSGNKIILASASPINWVTPIAQYLGLFDEIIGTSENINLKGEAKLNAIRQLIGNAKFTYIADHAVDLEIWSASDGIVTVNASKSLRGRVSRLNKPTQHIKDAKPSQCKLIFKQLRPHQWIKNALVFLPAVAGHKITEGNNVTQAIFAFIGFSLTASLVYVVNDLLDLKSDRNHHSKKNRPFASGNLAIKWGLLLVPSLFLGSVLFATLLPSQYVLWIGTYLILNIAYSLYLKQSVVVDIIILSMMYTLRIFAGSAATSVPVSEWLLSFSTLFFFSLACVKRYTEIIRSKNKITLDGRGYRQVDGGMVQSLGVGAGLLSILIILLYLQSSDVRSLYSHPQNLWFATPILLFWISRIWILTNRDEVHDDPVVFAVKDKLSWVCLVLLAIVFGVAT